LPQSVAQPHPRGFDPVTRCSIINLAEPLAGTAPLAQAWVLLEDNGPWGNKAPGTARFDSAAELATAASATDTSVLLVRQPGVRVTGPRRVWVAHVESQQLFSSTVADPSELLSWNLADIAAGVAPAGLTPSADFLWLVCTNSSRDACCALVGRPLVDDLGGLAANAGVTLLESSHLGGHRFAPTAMALPAGYVFGRLSVPTAVAAFEQLMNDAVPTGQVRGRTNLSRWQQAADIAVRNALGYDGIGGLRFEGGTGPVNAGTSETVRVVTPTGASVDVQLTGVGIEPRPESCGKGPVPGVSITATVLQPHGTPAST
jgi:hypothetical protein